MIEITGDIFDAQRTRRFGTANPERMNVPFWEWMIRGDAEDRERAKKESLFYRGMEPYFARQRFELDFDYSSAVWTFVRKGATVTELADGRTICIAGQYADFQEHDSCGYNDVIVFERSGEIGIYGYPETVFPPIDFHTSTWRGDQIFIIGGLGYANARQPDETPVFALDLHDYRITLVATSGECPSLINQHAAILDESGEIFVSGGETIELRDNNPILRSNFDDYAFNPRTGHWRVHTRRNWAQFTVRNTASKSFVPFDGEEIRANIKQFLGDDHGVSDFILNFDTSVYVAFNGAFDDEKCEINLPGQWVLKVCGLIEGCPVELQTKGACVQGLIKADVSSEIVARIATRVLDHLASKSGLTCVVEDLD